MVPNQNIWGDSKSWIDSSLMSSYSFEITNEEIVQIKVPKLSNFGTEDEPKNTLWENPNTPLSSPIDKSIAYAGLGDNSPFNTMKYLYADSDGVVYEPNYSENKEVSSFFLYEWDVSKVSSNSNLRSQNFYNSKDTTQTAYNRKRSAWEIDIDNETYNKNNTNLYVKPWLSFDIKSLVLCIEITCIKGITSDTGWGMNKTFILDDYLNDIQARVDYPYITNAKAIIYTQSNNNNRTRYQTSNGLRGFNFGILDPFKLPNQDMYFYTAFFTAPCEIPIFGLYKGWSTNQRDGQFSISLGNPEIYMGNNGTTLKAASLMTNELAEQLKKMVACFGLFFTDKEDIARNGKFDDENMYLGILENGIGNGKYSKGEKNKEQDQWNWIDSTECPYDPDNPFKPSEPIEPEPPEPPEPPMIDNILNITTNYSKTYPQEKSKIWEILLQYLNTESEWLLHWGIRYSDIVKLNNDSIFKYVCEKADLKEDFFASMIESFIDNSKQNNWNYNNSNFWNESINDLIFYFIKCIDPKTSEIYEKDGIIWEDKNGKIDLNNLNAGIPICGAAPLKIIDIKQADAGANFVENIFGKLEENKYKNVIYPWVLPWYNINGHSYSGVRGIDKIIGVLADNKELQFTKNQDNKWIRLLMPKYLRRVEVEDLNRNFWVIGQVLTAISAYLLDDCGPLVHTLESLLNEITQLWENVIYLWAGVATIPQNQRYETSHVEIVPVPINVFQPYLKYDNFNNLNVKNTEEMLIKHLDYLIGIYNKDNLCIIPFIRSNNYDNNYYSKIMYPGYLTFNRNTDSMFTFIPFDKNGISINLEAFEDKIYGIKENENTYSYYYPLSTDLKVSQKTKFFGLGRITYPSVIYNEKTGELLELTIEVNDAAAAAVGVNNDIVTITWTPDGTTHIKNDFISQVQLSEQEIQRGYYQGELLSLPKIQLQEGD